jgi:hypothetical protein
MRAQRAQTADGWDFMQAPFSVERRIVVPVDAPQRLVEDIQNYSALIELQSKMTGASAWYSKLS